MEYDKTFYVILGIAIILILFTALDSGDSPVGPEGQTCISGNRYSTC